MHVVVEAVSVWYIYNVRILSLWLFLLSSISLLSQSVLREPNGSNVLASYTEQAITQGTACNIIHFRDTNTNINSALNKKRLFLVEGTQTVLAVGSLITLNEIWYKDYPRSSFHTFNDNQEWLGMDKVGHAQTAYTTGRTSYDLLRWCNLPDKKSIWFGGLTGFAYQTAIEVLDGYSTQWGFSTGDILANVTGSALFISQQLIWNDQRIVPKFGFRRSGFAMYRPEVLGSNLAEQIVKDYNGQTYWLSINISSFLKEETRVPKWLNLAVGYGATGMTGGHENPSMTNSQGNAITFNRARQYYLSFDIDLTRINTKSRLLRTIFHTIGFLKIPAPGIELSKQGVRPLLFAF